MIQTSEKTRFTEAEMATVRDTDLPDLLISLGYQVKRIGRYYTTQEMDSIRIKDRRTWFRYSEGIGGDAITFLQRFYNKSFPEAVEYLLTWHGRARDSPPASTLRQAKEKEKKVPFTLPPANVDHRRVFAYLRKRGIAPQVIRGFVEAGLLYEDAQHHNCVFVGRDQSGAPVFANQRGPYDWNGSSFKGDVPGSNKDIAFRLYCSKKHDAVLVFDITDYVHDLDSRQAAVLAVDDGTLEHVARNGVQHVVLFAADLLHVPGEARNAADQMAVHLFREEVAVHVV